MEAYLWTIISPKGFSCLGTHPVVLRGYSRLDCFWRCLRNLAVWRLHPVSSCKVCAPALSAFSWALLKDFELRNKTALSIQNKHTLNFCKETIGVTFSSDAVLILRAFKIFQVKDIPRFLDLKFKCCIYSVNNWWIREEIHGCSGYYLWVVTFVLLS